MASMLHEAIVDLFKNRPSLGAELLQEALDVSIPLYDEARVASIDLTETQPAEYRADVVTLLLHAGKPVRVNIIEVQLAKNNEKRFTWPAYLGNARNKHRCPVDLLVVAPDPVVAAWCAEPISMGVPGFVLTPPVLGKTLVPVVTDPSQAERCPELAVLSAMTHGDSDAALDIVKAAVPAIEKLDGERSSFYYDLIYHSVNEAVRRALELMMKDYVYTSPLATKWIGVGREEGRDEGGRAGAARSLLTVLRVRGMDVPDKTRERILAEKDIKRVERWLERAAVASLLDDVLKEPS
jgi:hypothetical protein